MSTSGLIVTRALLPPWLPCQCTTPGWPAPGRWGPTIAPPRTATAVASTADVHQPRRPALDLVRQPGRGALALGHPVLEHEQQRRRGVERWWRRPGSRRRADEGGEPEQGERGDQRLDGGPQPEGGPVGQEHGEADGQRRDQHEPGLGVRRGDDLLEGVPGRLDGAMRAAWTVWAVGQQQPGGVAEQQPAGQNDEGHQRRAQRRSGRGRAAAPGQRRGRRAWRTAMTMSGPTNAPPLKTRPNDTITARVTRARNHSAAVWWAGSGRAGTGRPVVAAGRSVARPDVGRRRRAGGCGR